MAAAGEPGEGERGEGRPRKKRGGSEQQMGVAMPLPLSPEERALHQIESNLRRRVGLCPWEQGAPHSSALVQSLSAN